LCKKTDAEPNNNTIAIYSRYQCLGIDDIYERAASKAEETTERVPGHIVAVDREDNAVSNNGEDHEQDEGEETHASFEGGVITSKLEENRDYVYGDEDYGSAYSSYGEEDEHSPRLKKLH